MSYVLDASALLALAFGEPGAERVRDALDSAVMSTVNYSETLAKLLDRGIPEPVARLTLDALALPRIDFDTAQAEAAARLRHPTRALGLSFADRACLALAQTNGAVALTADRTWSALDIDITVELIR